MGYSKSLVIFPAAVLERFKSELVKKLLARDIKPIDPQTTDCPLEYLFEIACAGEWCVVGEMMHDDLGELSRLAKPAKPRHTVAAWVFDSDVWGWELCTDGKKAGAFKSTSRPTEKNQLAIQRLNEVFGTQLTFPKKPAADASFADEHLLEWIQQLDFPPALCRRILYGPGTQPVGEPDAAVETLAFAGRKPSGEFQLHELSSAADASERTIAVVKRILNLPMEYDAAAQPHEDERVLAVAEQRFGREALQGMLANQYANVAEFRAKPRDEQALIHLRGLLIHESMEQNRRQRQRLDFTLPPMERVGDRLYNPEHDCSIALPDGVEKYLGPGVFTSDSIFVVQGPHGMISLRRVSEFDAASLCVAVYREHSRCWDSDFTTHGLPGKLFGAILQEQAAATAAEVVYHSIGLVQLQPRKFIEGRNDSKGVDPAQSAAFEAVMRSIRPGR